MEGTVIVELASSADVVHELTEYTCSLLDEVAASRLRGTCNELAHEGKLIELISVFSSQLLKSLNEDSVTGFAILFSLLKHLDSDTLIRVVQSFCNELTKDVSVGEVAAKIALDVLQTLYSIVTYSPRARFLTFMSSLKYSISTKQEGQALADLSSSDIKRLCNIWEISPEETKDLYCTLCDVIADNKDLELDEQQMLSQLLESFEAANEEALSSISPYALRAVIGAIKHPLTVSKDSNVQTGNSKMAPEMFHLAAIQYLKKSPSPLHRSAFELLQVFCTGTYVDLVTFCSNHPGKLEELSLSEQVCKDNMRLLSLATLANESESVSYAKVAKALDINNSEVEQWVVRGKTSKLIDAKLDQLNERIVINRGSQRLFVDEQWLELGAKLKNWRNSVQTVLQSVRKAREDHDRLLETMAK